MNKMMVAALVLLAQMVFAATKPVGEVAPRRLQAEAQARIERSSTYEQLEKMKKEGKSILEDATMMKRIGQVIQATLKGIEIVKTGDFANIAKMATVDPLQVLTEVARLGMIIKSDTTTPQQKAMANKALELMSKSTRFVEAVIDPKNSTEGLKQQQVIAELIAASDKISTLPEKLDGSDASASFLSAYETAIGAASTKSIAQAVDIASNNKFTLKELLECE